MSRDMRRAIKKANMLRNKLVHRFILENSLDLTSPTGRRAVNEKLLRMFEHIYLANDIVSAVINAMMTKLGCDEKWALAKMKEMKDAIADCDVTYLDNPTPYKTGTIVTNIPDPNDDEA